MRKHHAEKRGAFFEFFPYTLMTPLTPSETGCRPCVYRGFDTLAPLNAKFPYQL